MTEKQRRELKNQLQEKQKAELETDLAAIDKTISAVQPEAEAGDIKSGVLLLRLLKERRELREWLRNLGEWS